MGDLEDAFLKKNVPGRYTSWSEEYDDKRGREDDGDNLYVNDEVDSEDDDYYLEGLPPLPSNAMSGRDSRIDPAFASTSNMLKKSCNTGVKGVLADYCEFQRREKEEDKLKQLEGSLTTQNRHRHRTKIDKNNNNNISNNDYCSNDDSSCDSNDDDNDGDDDAVVVINGDDQNICAYSKCRSQLPARTTPHPFLRKLQLPKVTPEEYVQLLDEMENNVYKGVVLHVIVHLYESSIPECRQLHSALKKIKLSTVEFSSCRFIEVDALEANPDMDTIILPTILIYDECGKLKHNLVRFTDDLPQGYTVYDLCEYFDKLGIIVRS